MYERLKRLGIPVGITRNSDTTLSPSERVKKALSFFGNSSDVILISNHINAGGGEGTEVIYALRDKSTLADKILGNLTKCGLKERKTYQKKSLISNKDYYFILRDTANTDAVIVEYGFIDNEKDLDKLLKNYKEYAYAVVDAIFSYKGIPIKYYVVEKGDTLYSIAKKYNMSVDDLMYVNELSSTTIQIGQQLVIKGNTYKVEKGDTLYSIAKKNNTTVEKLMDINKLKNTLINIGQELILP